MTVLLALIMVCSFSFLISGCSDDTWNKGEQGSLKYTENDNDPNLNGEIVTKEKAKELEFDEEFIFYIPNKEQTNVQEQISYTKKEWLSPQYVCNVVAAFMDREQLACECSVDGGAIINFTKSSPVENYCYMTQLDQYQKPVAKDYELVVLDSFNQTLIKNVSGVINTKFYICSSPYKSKNISSDDGRIF